MTRRGSSVALAASRRLSTRVLDVARRDEPPTKAGRDWQVAAEVPIEISLDGEPVAVVMATPTDIEDLVAGFLLTEGFVEAVGAIAEIRLAQFGIGVAAEARIGETRDPEGPPSAREAPATRRTRIIASRGGCGVCGVTRLDDAVGRALKVRATAPVATDAIARACDGLAAHQPLNTETHSVHAAALAWRDGTIVLAREDVGRHNALDKLIGALAFDDALPVDGFVVMSSRCSYELVQKASIAGAPLLATISAPTTLAIDTARAAGIKLAVCTRAGEIVFCD